jgi:putative Ca2+/H+ antiporter (TMEM165/GDT1 family)
VKISTFLASLIFVVLSEMGDKTQLLAMAFACKFKWQTVMWGIFVATSANHLLAAAAGGVRLTV